MASPKTEATELSLAFGILNRDPEVISPSEIPLVFEGTLSSEKFSGYLKELGGPNARLYQTLLALGAGIRHSHPYFGAAHSLRWLGPDQLSRSVSSAQDLLVCGIPVSIKTNSDVVYNRAPRTLFDRAPSGMLPLLRSEDWFLRNAPEDLQLLYHIAISSAESHSFPPAYTEFARASARKDRKTLQRLIHDHINPEAPAFRHAYEAMCHSVSKSSADLFNDTFTRTVASDMRIPMLDGLAQIFFRLDSTSYLLTGLDGNIPFAVNVPSITDWRREWQIRNIQALQDSTGGQCNVGFEFTFEHKKTRDSHTFHFHAEVRWSHGKFCGNPEAKLYKNFKWTDIPFLTRVV